MNDLISVIVPMYNVGFLIERLLKSLQNQTYSNFEVIIINDGSTDNCGSIAQEYMSKDKRIKLFSIENAGPGNARNIGLEKANGKYITFMDADDYVDEYVLEKLVHIIKEKNVKIVRYNYVKEELNGDIIECGELNQLCNKVANVDILKKDLLELLFLDKFKTYTPLMFIEASYIKNFRFRTDVKMMEDLIFSLELFFNCDSAFFFDLKGYHYVYNNSSLSHNRKTLIRNFKDAIKIISILENLLIKNNVDLEIVNKIYYIYSKIAVRFLARNLKVDDEYTLSEHELISLIKDSGIKNYIEKANFNSELGVEEYMCNLIKKDEYEKIYLIKP